MEIIIFLTQGEHLSDGVAETDYSITAGSTACHINSLHTSSMNCILSQPLAPDVTSPLPVKVRLPKCYIARIALQSCKLYNCEKLFIMQRSNISLVVDVYYYTYTKTVSLENHPKYSIAHKAL